MKRQDAIAIRAEIEHITNDVRDLEVSPSRAAALQCLADAMAHLARIKPIQTSQFLATSVVLASVPPRCTTLNDPSAVVSFERSDYLFREAPSVPPSCAENARVRSEATRSFQKSRELLRKASELLSGTTLRGIAEREHEKLLDEQAEGRK